MAHIFPGAEWRPMPSQEQRPKRRKGRGVGLHVAVYEGRSIYDINLGTGNDAHLYVRRDGSVEQNVDLDLQAWAGADGNSTMIWVETQGGTTAADVKSGRWPPRQAETLARIAAYAHTTEGTPLQVMSDSRPESRGIGTHRLGVQHSRGVGAVPGWLVVGGERWTKHIGKECPGDARVVQVPAIVARAQQIAAGQPAAAPKEWDEMASKAEIKDAVREVLGEPRDRLGKAADGTPLGGKTSFLAFVDWFDNAIQAIPGLILGTKIKRQGDLAAAQWGPDSETTVSAILAWSDENLMQLGTKIAQAVASGDPQAIAEAVAAVMPAAQAQKVAEQLVIVAKSG